MTEEEIRKDVISRVLKLFDPHLTWDTPPPNFLSYGDNNVLDFTDLDGITVIESTPRNFGGKFKIGLLKLEINNFKKLKYKDFFYNYKKYLNVVFREDLKNIF